jgi:membrane-associated phospholipid phosphatase
LFIYSRETLFFAVNDIHSTFFDKLMTVMSGFGRGDCIPIILCSLILVEGLRSAHYIFTTLSFGIVLPSIILLIKKFYGCPRPLVEFGLSRVHTVPWLDNAFYNSFPSGHTIGAFGFFMLLSFYLPKKQKLWSVLFFALALGCGISRLYLGQHYFKDIYVGSLIGVMVSTVLFIVAELLFGHRKSHKRKHSS